MTQSIFLRALVRLPVVIPIWFLAIIFPFFGPINSAVGALLVSFTVYIIPSLAHMLTFRSSAARQVNGPISVTLIFYISIHWHCGMWILLSNCLLWSSLVHYHLPHFEPIMSITMWWIHMLLAPMLMWGAYWSFRQLCWVLIADLFSCLIRSFYWLNYWTRV